ncbi:flagellar basal body P-ring formation chaperone FlgA [Hyphobacterium sp. HN65]|uniref:Flagellar basal body P-ring formation chaperone FlgA n=1 Tax=Hyphobacterium lacteum TaxID=3116575 RepID=A0ABU7LQK0_9PROT|nr:flagellar basal body P-ring formation chaperone FlgA [Hyphobacterium sp. HN65]MEE2526189.1 flagellar basal body P-ring formation chaperone FlgA [Hyphobacterium sp. HN65]
MRTVLFALALVLAPPPQLAFADDPVMLRETLRVDGPVITLGDLFAIDGEAASVVIARAPEPGRRTSIDPNYVRNQAFEHGLSWSNPNRLPRITVERASRIIDTDIIAEMVAGELYSRDGNEYDVALSGVTALHAPLDSSGLPQIISFDHAASSGVFQAELIAYEGAAPIRINGRAYATIEVPVLTRAIPAGHVISDGDLDWQSVRADRLRADAITSPDMMIGQEARRALRPGEAVRGYDLQSPVVVHRGDIVSLVFNVPGLTLTARARALEDAGSDEIARFVNLQSNRTVDAMVEGPGRARVVTAGPS